MVKSEARLWNQPQLQTSLARFESEWRQLPTDFSTYSPSPPLSPRWEYSSPPLTPLLVLESFCFPYNHVLLDHNYVTPGSLTVPGFVVTLLPSGGRNSCTSSDLSMLPYRNHSFGHLSEGGDAKTVVTLVIPKLELNPEHKAHKSPKKTRCKAKSKVKSKTSKKENVHCGDASYIQPTVKSKKTPKRIKEEIKTKPITDYFPSQRSKRKTSVAIKKEKAKEFEESILSGVEDGFEVHDFLGKGRGVIANKKVEKGDFVLEYYGELITMEEAKRRELFYANNETIGCYMYYFTHGNKHYCVDATKETTRLGRLVNHSKKGNLKTKTFLIEESPHLILVADRDILPGEELLYDYGDRSKRSLQYYPWLAT